MSRTRSLARSPFLSPTDGYTRGPLLLSARQAAASLSHTSGLRAVHGQRRRDVDILFLRVHIQMATSSLSGYE